MPKPWAHKDLLGLENLSVSEIDSVLERASFCKRTANPRDLIQALKSSFAALLFLEPSIRTRMSFDIALKRFFSRLRLPALKKTRRF
jgi:aspartate carbamoyltransferase catalytic subunit